MMLEQFYDFVEVIYLLFVFVSGDGDHRYLHVLTHSFPTRRSSDRFIPHIRDLPSKRLYVFNPAGTPQELRGLVGGKIREETVVQNWPDILRSAATMVAGIMPPSQLLRKFASYPRQHDLAVALREVGRIERTLFLIDWVLDVDMHRRARIRLNKGEAHHRSEEHTSELQSQMRTSYAVFCLKKKINMTITSTRPLTSLSRRWAKRTAA